MMKILQKTIAVTVFSTLVIIPSLAHADTTSQTVSSSISSALKNVVGNTKENGAKNSLMRNQLVSDQSADLQNKERLLVNQLNLSVLNLKNIQTRITAKSVEVNAPGTETSAIDGWLATSSLDMVIAQKEISFFASSTSATPAALSNPISIVRARKLANTAIDAVNSVRDDLQSALDALTAVL